MLATHDGTPVGKLENKDGKLKVGDVEKLVQNEVKQRETSLDASLKDAKAKAAAGDREGAIKLYQSVLGEKCMFPRKAKDAAKGLKKLGINDVARVPDAPVFEAGQSASSAVPEPAGLSILCLGAATLLGRRRRRRS